MATAIDMHHRKSPSWAEEERVCVDVWMCIDVQVPRDQRRVTSSLELQAVVSHLTWILGTELGSSGKATSALWPLRITK